MLTDSRWGKEQELMQSVFPEFRPYMGGSSFGFRGYLKGPRSGQIYGVTLEGDPAVYPQWPPKVHIEPHIGIHWIGEGEHRRLCMEREWRPARSTFANTLLAVVRYLDENDPTPGAAPPPEAADPPACGTGEQTRLASRFRALLQSWRLGRL